MGDKKSKQRIYFVNVSKMTVTTKPIIKKKDQKVALLDDSENLQLPEVTVTQPKESIKVPAKKKVIRASQSSSGSGDNACSTIFTFLVVTGIIFGLSYFSLNVYRKKWLERRGRPWMETQMQRLDASEIKYEPTNIKWISVYMRFDGPSLIIGGFDDLSKIEKTPKEMNKQIVITDKIREVGSLVQNEGMIELKFEYSEEVDTLEMLQMPELSNGRYVHDFDMKKTLIVDSDNGRCFIADLDETEIQKPTNICQLLHGIETGGVYKMDLNEVRKETFAHEINSVNSTVFGCPIATISRNSCDKFYQLYDIHDEILDEILDQDYGLDEIRREKRSADDDVNNEYDFVEFAGKSLVKYNIVNVKDL